MNGYTMDNITIDKRKKEIKIQRIRKVRTIRVILLCLILCLASASALGVGQISRNRRESEAKKEDSSKENSSPKGFEELSENMMGAVVVGKASIYDSANKESEKLKTLGFGEKVRLTEESETWFQVKKGDMDGYMKKSDVVEYDKTKKQVALTFDDGPSSKTTPEVLDALEKYDCRATFFLVGQNITPKTGKILERQEKLGCELGNHTYSHANLKAMKKKSDIKEEIDKANDLIKKYTGKKASFVRTPYGATNKNVLSVIGAANIYWSIDTEDWKYRDTERLIKVVSRDAKDGSIILMHDIHESTAEAVAQICKKLKKKDFEMVTVTELAAIKGTDIVNGKTYYSFEGQD